ncbi:hypothetical protein ACWD4G_33485 [Streptomyces sp. NPDC002643]
MEQRIGSNSQPLAAAAVDPSHIPGLTAPVSVTKEKQEEPEDNKPTESAEPAETEEQNEAAPKQKEEPEADADEEASEAAPDTEVSSDAEETEQAEKAKATEGDEDDQDAEDAEDAEKETPSDGPVFEASDRRAKIVADSEGVHLTLDDQRCEFRWDEIGAIETESPRFGKRFTVTVHTPDRRWYPIEIEAKSKSQHRDWETEIDKVLDAYFEDGEAESEAETEESAP